MKTRKHLFLLTVILMFASTGLGGCSDAATEPVIVDDDPAIVTGSYNIVDTAQSVCFDNQNQIGDPSTGDAFFGQDGQHTGNQPSYVVSADDLTVLDEVSGLTWQKSPDTNGDDAITAADKYTWAQSQAYPAALNGAEFGGFSDWRLPTIKELYSLILFSGLDPSGYTGDTSGLVPFIDTDAFDFAYGDESAGERIIDAQYASSTLYVDSSGMEALLFGVNFADGRIKGYGMQMPGGREKTFFVTCVRGNSNYGLNVLSDNGDGTISDEATGLMWAQDDSGAEVPEGLNWQDALAWVATKNAAGYLGYADWRLPSAKELQSLLDYSCSPGTTGSAAIDAVFNATGITNEAGQADYPAYWTSTTHENMVAGGSAVYVNFGRAMGYMDGGWRDVHGAGAQRSDPKVGDPADFPTGHGPQGDAIRIYNGARMVR